MKSKLLFVLTLTSLYINTLATYSYSSNPSVVYIPSTSPPSSQYHYQPIVPIKYHTVIPVKTYEAPDKSHSTQYHAQDSLGQYSYGYSTSNGIEKNEARSADGTVVGGYSYISPEGQQVVIKYTAGEEGFKATGNVIPQQVEATPEVAQATYEHMMAKAEAEKKSEHPEMAAYTSYSPYGLPYVYHYPIGYNAYAAYNTHAYPEKMVGNNYMMNNMNMDKMLYNYKFSY
uniref:Uncharacterized protein n=1 Tax=Strigamia maritima TaxID=126957 RepID=T1JIX6_STRMM